MKVTKFTIREMQQSRDTVCKARVTQKTCRNYDATAVAIVLNCLRAIKQWKKMVIHVKQELAPIVFSGIRVRELCCSNLPVILKFMRYIYC